MGRRRCLGGRMEQGDGLNKILYFDLLGVFGCGATEEEKAKNAVLISRLGKKALFFLQYLVVNHGRSVSAEELIEHFWADNSSNPANALRNMLFKVRGVLKAMFPEEEGLLLTLQDCYGWSPKVALKLDAERFEALCLRARGLSGEEYCAALGEAVSAYKGDFLSGNDGEWARTLRQYYQTLYLDACRAVLPLLHKKERWVDVVSVCSQAYAVDFGMEDFTAYQMQALIALGQPGQAVERYEDFRKRMMEEYGMPPTERIEQLRSFAAGMGKANRDKGDIFRLVCQEEPDSRAFFCTFEIFQSIVALERRHLERSGQTSCLVIISLGKGSVPATDGRRLEKILLEWLRSGDPIARLEAGSYIVMLTGTDAEKAQLVTGRIDCAFHRTYRHSNARLTFQVADLKVKYHEDEIKTQ